MPRVSIADFTARAGDCHLSDCFSLVLNSKIAADGELVAVTLPTLRASSSAATVAARSTQFPLRSRTGFPGSALCAAFITLGIESSFRIESFLYLSEKLTIAPELR